MSNLDNALRALRDASDAQLKKLYLKKKDEPEEKKEDEELSDEDAELLKQMLEE